MEEGTCLQLWKLAASTPDPVYNKAALIPFLPITDRKPVFFHALLKSIQRQTDDDSFNINVLNKYNSNNK